MANRHRADFRDQALALHRSSIVLNAAVMSSQALIRPGRDVGRPWQGQAPGTGDLDLPRLREGEVNVLFQAICGGRGEDEDRLPLQGLELADTILTDMLQGYPDDFEQAYTATDVRDIRARGRIAVVLAMQAGQYLGGSVRALRMFHRLGVRLMTMTHAFTNRLCDSSTGSIQHNGLSDVGREVVAEMNRLAIIPDITHATDLASHQILDLSRGSVVATHSNARSICTPGEELSRVFGNDNFDERNLSDELLQRLAASGGVACVNFAPALVSQAFADSYPKLKRLHKELSAHRQDYYANNPDDVLGWRAEQERFMVDHDITPATLEDVVEHVEHFVDVVGWEHVGIGTDWEGTGGFHPRHLEDVSTIPDLTAELLARGHAPEDVRLFLGENMLRVLEETRQAADASPATG